MVAEQASVGDQTLAQRVMISELVAEPDERPLPIVRQRALTHFGGLLFLIGLIEDLRLPEEMLSHASLKERPFRWIMHQLALTLVHCGVNDPAAMAFAGMLPDSNALSDGEDPPACLEEQAIHEFAERITASLRQRLDLPGQPISSLIEFVCHRRAEIVADPGWIEARFALDDVSTEIRRMGLDLDPGYVPWLGVVVRFVYE